MFKRLFAAAVVLGAAALAPPPASAQAGIQNVRPGGQVCAPRTELVRKLEKKFGERKQGVGLVNAERAFELWSSERTGTWTMLFTRADGISCIIAAGKSWHDQVTPIGTGA